MRHVVSRFLAVLGGAAVLSCAALAAATPANAAADSDRLNPAEQLVAGQRLVSPDGQFVVLMQGDGNLVEYAPGNRPVWATGTSVGNSVALMQGDGNLVVIAPGNRAVWATGTSGNTNATLELQNDGNLVVYAQGHVARWASGSRVGGGLTQRILDTARTESGNGSRNHETGTNCNFYSGALGAGSPCSGGWRAEEWCADFARWVWGQSGARTSGLTAAAGSFASYGRSNGTWRAGSAASNARAGDAVVFNLSGSYASHVGIVTAVNSDGTITMISGNSSDAVRQTTVNPASAGVSGYTSPV